MDTYERIKFYNSGFTMVELMITITIAGVVAAFGVPSFTQAIQNSRLTTSANELVASLGFARSEAVKRNQAITVRKSLSEWEDGWIVFVDDNEDGVKDLGETMLRVYDGMPNNYTLRSTGINRVTFQSTGISGNGSFVLCENGDGNNIPEAFTSRVVIINTVGRVRMGVDTDDNGIPEKDDGEIVSCVNSPFV